MTSGWKYVVRQLLWVALIAVLCLIFLAIGLMIGYGVIGEGDNAFAILSPTKWDALIAKFTGQ